MSQDLKDYDYTAKVVNLGDAYVGKSAIAHQFCERRFKCEFPCMIGFDFRVRTIQTDEKKVKLYVWETAGQEKWRAHPRSYYRGTHGIILCFDITKRESFDKIEFWMEEIRQYAKEDVCVVLVGNKCDLLNERVVSAEEGRQKADSYGKKFFETSAKEDINIDEVYFSITRDINKVFENQKCEDKKLLSKKPENKTECFKCS